MLQTLRGQPTPRRRADAARRRVKAQDSYLLSF
jgi:hypothetical protein